MGCTLCFPFLNLDMEEVWWNWFLKIVLKENTSQILILIEDGVPYIGSTQRSKTYEVLTSSRSSDDWKL